MTKTIAQFAALVASLGFISPAVAGVGVGAKPIAGAELILDGSRDAGSEMDVLERAAICFLVTHQVAGGR